MARKKKAVEVAPPAETPVETPVAPQPETFEVDLFDTVPVVINGQHVQLQKGKQAVSKQIYNVLKDAKLI